MSTAVKRPQPKPVRVAPTVTDPSMRNTRGPAEMLLNSETGGDQPDDHETVFGGTQKTKEEQDTTQPESSQNNTMLIVVFALIVIALVALIVWMLMKQSNDKKDEEEMRRMIQPQPHPRNNMPPGYGQQGQMHTNQGQQRMQGMTQNQGQSNPLQISPADFEAHQRNMALMHQQQATMQQHMAQMNADLADTESADQGRHSKKSKKSKSFAEVMAEKDGKVIPPLKEPLLDEDEPTKKLKFTKKNPHPGILRPGGSEFQSDVDDVLAQTSAMLQSSKSSKSGKSMSAKKSVRFDKSKKEELTDLDKALLDKVNSNADGQDEDDDTQE